MTNLSEAKVESAVVNNISPIISSSTMFVSDLWSLKVSVPSDELTSNLAVGDVVPIPTLPVEAALK